MSLSELYDQCVSEPRRGKGIEVTRFAAHRIDRHNYTFLGFADVVVPARDVDKVIAEVADIRKFFGPASWGYPSGFYRVTMGVILRQGRINVQVPASALERNREVWFDLIRFRPGTRQRIADTVRDFLVEHRFMPADSPHSLEDAERSFIRTLLLSVDDPSLTDTMFRQMVKTNLKLVR